MSFKETEIGLIPSEWDFNSLKSSLYIKGRIGWKGLKKSEYLNFSDYRIINGSNIIDNKIDWDNCGYISQERYEESPEIILNENDIVMTKDGTIGKLAIIKKLDKKTTVASGLFVIRIEDNSIDVYYLYNYFNSHFFKELIKSRIEGSVIPHLYQRDLVELKIPLPPLPEQKAIANILSTLDEKIEVNNQINKTLENIAQTIFKQWFVDFEFPNGDGEPYKSSGGEMVESELGMIPKGWEVISINDICEVSSSKRIFANEYVNKGIPFYRSKEIIEKNRGNNITTELFISVDKYNEISKNNPVPEKGDILLTSVGTLGIPYIVGNEKFYFKDGNLTWFRDFKNSGYRNIIYLWILSKKGKEELDALSIGSTQKALTISALKKIKILKIDDELLSVFEKLTSAILDTIKEKNNENACLIKLRDSLLPKLMSGEIRVPIEEN